MSYNIDTCNVKKLDKLVIPLKAFYLSERKDWHPKQPEIINAETMEVVLLMGCGQSVTGHLKDGNVHVTEIELAGEGSGSLMHYVMTDALKQSTGELEAVMIWEGGDSITRLTVKDGVLNEEGVEL